MFDTVENSINESRRLLHPIFFGHLDSRHRRFPAFVPGFAPGALDRLFESIGGQYAKRHRNTTGQSGTGDALAGLGGNVIKVWRRPTNQGSQTDHGITSPTQINDL